MLHVLPVLRVLRVLPVLHTQSKSHFINEKTIISSSNVMKKSYSILNIQKYCKIHISLNSHDFNQYNYYNDPEDNYLFMPQCMAYDKSQFGCCCYGNYRYNDNYYRCTNTSISNNAKIL